VRLLFVKHSLVWPRSSGHDVHTFHMMKACGELGHEISLATVVPPEPKATEGLTLRHYVRLTAPIDETSNSLTSTWLQGRFRSFWGVDDLHVLALKRAVDTQRPDAVVIVGLDALPYFPPLEGTVRIWYAADEWVLHHLSMLQLRGGQLIENLKAAAIKGLYERAHRRVVDRAWVVTDRDRVAMQRFAGIDRVDVLPNGVDADFFKPGAEPVEDRTAVFWGRLDFGPNIQALEWFCRKVWPRIRSASPEARFKIVGFQPGDKVKALASAPGVALEANVRDLRPVVRRQALAVLPLVSGAGIKNKLLEAAAMGLPVVCTPLATLGLRGEPPVITASSADDFANAVLTTWSDPQSRAGRAKAIREWVTTNHSWRAAAETAMAALANHLRSGQR
jgi:glycosyltransferase involved in cell wall biosynthesis